jgi:hypothetical protein
LHGGSLSESAQTGHLRQGGARLLVAAHFLENVGKQDILARLIRLSRDGSSLDLRGFI